MYYFVGIDACATDTEKREHMIIFLNGASSSGKTTIASALQELSSAPLLVFGIDKFLAMMPKKYIGRGEKAKEGFQYKVIQEGAEPIAKVVSGKYGAKVANTAPYVIEALASCGHNVIVDEVILSEDNLKQYVKILREQKVYFVGVRCSVEELDRREISRGNRVLGLGRDQINQVHKHAKQFYDLELDTAKLSAFDCAKQILNYVENNPNPHGFKRLPEVFRGK